MSSKKIPIHIRARERLIERLERQGADEALRYAVAVASDRPDNARLRQSLLMALPADLRERFESLLQAEAVRREAKRAAQEEALDLAFRQAKERERERSAALVEKLERARRIGQADVVVAAMALDERRVSGATRDEIARAIALRRDAIRSTRLKEILGCTDTEIKRWSEDGRLPVLFRRRMPVDVAGKTLDVRHWSQTVVSDALAHIDVWREEDAQARRTRRVRRA